MSILERHADKWTPEPNTGCYLWTAALSTGRTNCPSAGWNGKVVRVTRIVCEETHGSAPTPKHNALHNTPNGCIGSICIAPAHLRWGTQRENMQDIMPEARSDRIKRGAANMGPEKRMERARKMLVGRLSKQTLEQRSDALRKGWATRRANLRREVEE